MLVRAGAGAEAWHGDRVACAWRRDVRVARWGRVNGGREGGGGPGEGQRESALRWQTRAAALRQWHAGVIIQRHHLVPPPAGRRLSLGHTHTHTHTHILSLSAPPRGASHPRPSPCAGARPAPPHPALPPRPFSPRQCPCPPLIAPPLAHRCPNPRARRAELRGAARQSTLSGAHCAPPPGGPE